MSSSQKFSSYWQRVKESFSELSLSFFKKSFSSAFQNIRRNGLISLSSIFVLTLILVLFHVSLALKFFANESLVSLNKKVDFILEIRDDAGTSEILGLQKEIKEYPGISSVQFVSKEEALEGFLLRHENIKHFLEKYKLENPLPATLEIQTQNPEDLETLMSFLKSASFEKIIDNSKLSADIQQKSSIEKLVSLGSL